MTLLITGGAGFIGSNLVHYALNHASDHLVIVDKLTYAGSLLNLDDVLKDARVAFVKADIGDAEAMARLFADHRPSAVVNLAAETHVDRSIDGPRPFVDTNLVGTFVLLEAARAYTASLDADARARFRFLHVSTDEVYGSLGANDPAFCETTAYAPNSPYSASKAASDHLVRAYRHTYGLPTLTTNCSNNYGPRQFPEKLIPLMITNALAGKSLPVYGDGRNVRDWLYVGDHCAAIAVVLERGAPGGVYNIGGSAEMSNLDVVHTLCAILADHRPGIDYKLQIRFVADRPGHDRRYAIDASKIRSELDWQPAETFQSGLRRTVRWYLDNAQWLASVQSKDYQKWVDLHYAAA